ncbi:cell envelope biogenesis protein OmpA [Peteryoungia algae]|uniref:Cell envelope biogenesis protein OmpA n=1 Tax=Peteryoungia algae TaxID=2919917 RepID=A0ABT0CZG8_9HYPH|nr:cell envelope biogenesis protein OmpA [Rhizobium sp. SSM4.3]MCJ8238564.1 cell envelope biogenesis protein OmpA [Rhizobium sp. SSM4.3]
MFETAFALGLTQFARSLSFPERVRHRTMRNAALEPWRLRNTGIDALYYDVKALTADEAFYISDSIASEGLIMIVPPTGGGMLTLCDSVDEFRLCGGRNVRAMAVAGIGGSAIGAAAFARNVADAIGAPVAAVVSGYGLGDIVNEAIGGAFLFGWLGHIRSNLEVIDDVVGRPKLGAYGKRDEDADTDRRTGLDSDTVATLLDDATLNFTLIAGHSRGNRVIADALEALEVRDPGRVETLARTARIVTFGGRIKMPDAFTEVIDVVGELDWFGEMNSRPKIAADIKVPFCGHSTNTDLPGALQVTKILGEILNDKAPAAENASAQVVEAPLAPAATKVAAEAAEIVEAVEDAAPPVIEEQPVPPMASPEPETPVAVEATAPAPSSQVDEPPSAADVTQSAKASAPPEGKTPPPAGRKPVTPIMAPLPRGRGKRTRPKT